LPFRIERATNSDVDAIQRVLRETWLDTYSPYLAQSTLDQVTTVWHDAALLAARISDPEIFFAVARDNAQEICGLVTAQKRESNDLFIYRLYVRPGLQHQGIGTALLQETLAAFPGVPRILLQVVANNEKGFAFWHKHGFTEYAIHEEMVAGERIRVTEMQKQVN
jgi:ribosomal protein S18 acetylase RimI-like enzyme